MECVIFKSSLSLSIKIINKQGIKNIKFFIIHIIALILSKILVKSFKLLQKSCELFWLLSNFKNFAITANVVINIVKPKILFNILYEFWKFCNI